MGRCAVYGSGLEAPETRTRPGPACRRWEHTFVTSQGSALTRYRRALASGNPNRAWMAALELEYVNLLDALSLLYVLAAAGDQRYSPAAGRWLGRLVMECELRLEEALTAAAALVVIRSEPRSQDARLTLEGLIASG